VPERFWFADSGKWISHDRIDQIDDLEGHASIVRDPIPKVLSKLVLEDAVPISHGDEGTAPWRDRTRALRIQVSEAYRSERERALARREGVLRSSGSGEGAPFPVGSSTPLPRRELRPGHPFGG
jgi:hypothetical protein